MQRHATLLAVTLWAMFFTAECGLASDCSRTSVGFTPLNDLGSGLYKGFQGGLYPRGRNTRPDTHEAAGVALARQIRPLDSNGIADDNGKIVLVSIGLSNTTQEFSTFKPIADADPARNPNLVIVDGAQGGMSADRIDDLNATTAQQYWTFVDSRLKAAGVTPRQVQAAWVKEADPSPRLPFPDDALKLKNELALIAQILKSRFPNIRMAYYSSRIYAGYASTNLNPEPFAYQSGFAVKWLIEDQINGSVDLNFDPSRGPVRAPWLAWGPYLWADGLNPRSDGLTYVCSDLADDGTHPASNGGREKVAQMLLSFLKTDSTAQPWFLRAGAGNPGSIITTATAAQAQTDLEVTSGGVAATTTAGASTSVRSGYAKVNVIGGAAPYATAVFSLTQNGVVVSEAGVPVTPATTFARFFIEYRSSAGVSINTGFAAVNQATGATRIALRLRDSSGAILAQGAMTLGSNAHMAKFVDQLAPDLVLPPNFASGTGFGSLELQSDQPLVVMALRLTTNQRGETLLTTTPAADLNQPTPAGRSYFPQVVDGRGYQTAFLLLNTSNSTETGTLRFFDDAGAPLPVGVVGASSSSAVTSYSIPANGFFRIVTDGSGTTVKVGSVLAIPDGGSAAPVGAAIFSYSPSGILVTESGVPAAALTTHARLYVDKSGGHNTGVAVADATGASPTIAVSVYQNDGVTLAGRGSLVLAANGHISRFVDEIVQGLPASFTGVMELISSPAPFAAVTLRSLVNARGDFLLTTFPMADQTRPAPASIVFPQIADGGGYSTQFILLSASASATATLNSFGDDGSALSNILPRVIPGSFFGMATVDPDDYPAITIGALGHPATFAWGWIERSRGVYAWTGFDKHVSAAQNHGVDLVLTLGWTPGWALANQSTCTSDKGPTLCTAPPDNIQDWKDFITQVAMHYKGQVKYYELWNEANARNFWSGSVEDMVKMAEAAYPIIKSIDPDAIVITPSVTGVVGNAVSNSASNWMTQYLQAGGSRYADVGSFHGYVGRTGVRPYPMPEDDTTPGCVAPTDCQGSIITKANTMRAVFDNNGMAGKPMFDTEGSWGNGNITDPDTQIAWLARWYLLQASLGVSRAYWYTWGGGASQPWGNVETDAKTPTSAALAFERVYGWLARATIKTPCALGPDSHWTCGLSRPGGYEALVIWNTTTTKTYAADAKFKQYRDLAGQTFPITGTLNIGPKPILLETSNVRDR